ncbi:MAG: DEAD/DEAH box helicase, partial [Chitinophagales bacterium]|nr:DEAD/DEAH box helicase [Chitinophagales bacterium]
MERSELAYQYALHTDQNLFITGKAGTGKTTLLHKIVSNSSKNIVVAAPTGVAAMNAQGVTLHSLFFLPFTAYLPTNNFVDRQIAVNKHMLIKDLRLNSEKRKLIRNLDTLIIDEMSMVRADTLDAIDEICQHVRQNNLPFGGLQIIAFGDLFQLPPVVKQEEKALLQEFYPSEFFFSAHSYQAETWITIELDKIYRQKNQIFVDLLNHIRHQALSPEDVKILASRYNPNFKPEEEGWIYLNTHNAQADKINQDFLNKIKKKPTVYISRIKGQFPSSMFPIAEELIFKEGAQVMFIKNDIEFPRRYYNGLIGKIVKLSEDEILVSVPDQVEPISVNKEVWRNIDYKINSDTREVEESVIGTFTQFPLRLAWAITIHKSQGLTFDKVVLDAGRSFASGQVYVALSRCTSLEGLVLTSPIQSQNLFVRNEILLFKPNFTNEILEESLIKFQAEYNFKKLLRVFDLTFIKQALYLWQAAVLESKIISANSDIAAQIPKMQLKILDWEATLEIWNGKVTKSYHRGAYEEIYDLAHRAAHYFESEIDSHIYQPLQEHLEKAKLLKSVKGYLSQVEEISYA